MHAAPHVRMTHGAIQMYTHNIVRMTHWAIQRYTHNIVRMTHGAIQRYTHNNTTFVASAINAEILQTAARVQPVDSRSTSHNAQARTQCDATCGRRHEGRLHEQHHAHEHVHAGAGGDHKRQGRLPAVPASEPRGSDTQTKRYDVQSIMPPEHMFDHIKAARMALTMPHQ